MTKGLAIVVAACAASFAFAQGVKQRIVRLGSASFGVPASAKVEREGGSVSFVVKTPSGPARVFLWVEDGGKAYGDFRREAEKTEAARLREARFAGSAGFFTEAAPAVGFSDPPFTSAAATRHGGKSYMLLVELNPGLSSTLPISAAAVHGRLERGKYEACVRDCATVRQSVLDSWKWR